MGVVFEATRADGSFEKRVAIKILRHDHIDDLFLRRFEHERRILAQLDHPHIASILDAGTTPAGDPHFVMEFVDGIPITEYCRVHNLSIRQRLDLFLQICDAVEHAHRHLTVHRDLKPSNILVTEAGAVKLLDFGIAKLLEPDSPAGAETVALLTPEYTSPEQIRKEPITTSTDIFALGILLYEILAGEHPFRKSGQLPHEVMRAIVEDDPPPSRLDSELDAIVLTALHKQPSWRYPSVAQLADDIGRYMRGWPVLAKGNGAGVPARQIRAPPVAAFDRRRAADRRSFRRHLRHAPPSASRRRSARPRRRAKIHRGAKSKHREPTAPTWPKPARSKPSPSAPRNRSAIARSGLLPRLSYSTSTMASAIWPESSTARRLIVTKAQQQLELLSAGSEKDPELQRDLAAAYERMGELRVDPAQPAKANAAAALDAYRRGRRPSPQDRRAARQASQGTAATLPSASRNWATAKCWLATWTRLSRPIRKPGRSRSPKAIRERSAPSTTAAASLSLPAGNTAKALESCQEGIAVLDPLAKSAPQDAEVQRLIATTEASYANALRLSRKPAGRCAAGAPGRRIVRSSGSARAQQCRIPPLGLLCRNHSGSEPRSHRRQRRQSRGLPEIGAVHGNCHRNRSRRPRLAAAAGGDSAGVLQTSPADRRPDRRSPDRPGRLWRCWNGPRKNPPPEPSNGTNTPTLFSKWNSPIFCQPAKALHLAQNAVAATNRTNPFFLDTLAWAYFRSGDAPKAAETERDALRLLPAGAKGGLHDELQHGLETFTK